MKIKSIDGEFAKVKTGKLLRTVNIQMLPKVKTGDYVIVHAGFAIEKVNPQKAEETLRLLENELRLS
jgi:hydrogenase expression/formation protein HypC